MNEESNNVCSLSRKNGGNNNRVHHDIALKQLEAAIELMPLESRLAYTEARERCPHLIETESNPIYWLMYSKFDVWAAAQRLVKFWEWRKVLFQDRAFLSLLDLSRDGIGALDAEDFSFFETGFCVRVPSTNNSNPTTQQQRQKHVIFTDRNRMLRNYDSMERSLRIPFYYATHVMAESGLDDAYDVTQTSMVVIDLFTSIPKYRSALMLLEIARESFPFKFDPILLAVPYTQKKMYYQVFFPSILRRLGTVFSPDKFVVHLGDSKLDLQRKLEAYGLTRDCLPRSVGGTWTYDRFAEWFQQERNCSWYQRMLCTALQRYPASYPECYLAAGMSSSFATRTLLDPIELHQPISTDKGPERIPHQFNPDALEAPPVNNNNFTFYPPDDSVIKLLDSRLDCVSQVTSTPLTPILPGQGKKMEVFMGRLPWMQKGVYIEATERCPDLVERESNPLCFLTFEKNKDEVEAAHHLALYWQKRKELFGELAFRRIKEWFESTNEEVFEKCVNLPNDSNGRTVVLFDTCHATGRIELTKCIFYNLAILMRNQRTCVNDAILLFVCNEDKIQLAAAHGELLSELQEFFPIKFSTIHAIVQSSGTPILNESKISPLVHSKLLHLYRKDVYFHVMNSTSKVVASLTKFGLRKEGLPCSVGGGWTFSSRKAHLKMSPSEIEGQSVDSSIRTENCKKRSRTISTERLDNTAASGSDEEEPNACLKNESSADDYKKLCKEAYNQYLASLSKDDNHKGI